MGLMHQLIAGGLILYSMSFIVNGNILIWNYFTCLHHFAGIIATAEFRNVAYLYVFLQLGGSPKQVSTIVLTCQICQAGRPSFKLRWGAKWPNLYLDYFFSDWSSHGLIGWLTGWSDWRKVRGNHGFYPEISRRGEEFPAKTLTDECRDAPEILPRNGHVHSNITHMLHGAGYIYLQNWVIFRANVGKIR